MSEFLKAIFTLYCEVCTAFCTTGIIIHVIEKIDKAITKKLRNRALKERIEKEYAILTNENKEAVKDIFEEIENDEYRESALGCIKRCDNFSEECKNNKK